MNELLAVIKTRIKSITKHFHYNEEIINILTLCYYAIVSFDDEAKDILEEVLSTKYILVNDGAFDEMLKKYYPKVNINKDTYIEASFDEKEKYHDDFIIICDWHNTGREVSDVLDVFLHEIKHAMNSTINSYQRVDGQAVSLCGLCETEYRGYSIYSILEEAFNSFLVKLYLKQIEKLSSFNIEDPGLNDLLSGFCMIFYSYSYEKATKVMLPFFNNNEFFTLFYNAALYKDYAPLFDRLEEVIDNSPYHVFSNLLDAYYDSNNSAILYVMKKVRLTGKKLSLKFNKNNLTKFDIS